MAGRVRQWLGAVPAARVWAARQSLPQAIGIAQPWWESRSNYQHVPGAGLPGAALAAVALAAWCIEKRPC